MRFALDVAPLGDFADPGIAVRLAQAAEAVGWDGFSTWDSLGVSMATEAADPFVTLAAVGAATQHIELILSAVALPRHRPQRVVQAAGTLDRLSGGRFVLGIVHGGDPRDFTAFGEDVEVGARLERLDEGVEVVDALLRGETLSHRGVHYVVDGVAVGPRPARQPRPPIWLGAVRPGGIRRAARWDGWIAISVGEDGTSLSLTPEGLAAGIALARETRARLGLRRDGFEVAVFGQAGLGGFAPSDYAGVGATWWLESVSGLRGSPDDVLRIVEVGPPRA